MGANYLTNQREILANAFLLGNQKSQLKAQKSWPQDLNYRDQDVRWVWSLSEVVKTSLLRGKYILYVYMVCGGGMLSLTVTKTHTRSSVNLENYSPVTSKLPWIFFLWRELDTGNCHGNRCHFTSHHLWLWLLLCPDRRWHRAELHFCLMSDEKGSTSDWRDGEEIISEQEPGSWAQPWSDPEPVIWPQIFLTIPQRMTAATPDMSSDLPRLH